MYTRSKSSDFRASNTLKTPGSEIGPERVHWGQTPFRVNDDLKISQLDTECDPELGQSDPIMCHVCRKLTNFRVIFDPEWSLAPMDPFPGHADLGVFRVNDDENVLTRDLSPPPPPPRTKLVSYAYGMDNA